MKLFFVLFNPSRLCPLEAPNPFPMLVKGAYLGVRRRFAPPNPQEYYLPPLKVGGGSGWGFENHELRIHYQWKT